MKIYLEQDFVRSPLLIWTVIMAIKCEATVASCISYETYLAQTPKLEDGIKRNLCLVSVLFKSKPYKAEAKNEEGS